MDSTLLERLVERNKKQTRVLDPAKAQGFMRKAQTNLMHYAEYVDALYVYDNNIEKSQFGRELPWLFKYRLNRQGEKEYRCSKQICKFNLWKNIVDETTEVPLCKKACDATSVVN
mmetsp:Transcript_16111/g.28970  ORF Transcript_16111/g.28970 Transcript_16111/m.28970 type:complete len:115 (-) Transcript_16111:298-642(-)